MGQPRKLTPHACDINAADLAGKPRFIDAVKI